MRSFLSRLSRVSRSAPPLRTVDRRLHRLAWTVLPIFAVACSGADDLDDVADHHDHDEEGETLGTVSSELTSSSSVASAVSQTCSTNAVKGLSVQLVEEIQCLKPGVMKRIDGVSGLALGSTVFPFLQTPTANALIAAQKARGVTLSINSGLRALPAQYLLYRWYQTGRCGISLAAKPGTSNHESGVAVDIANNAAWRSAMNSKGFSWLGASDPVHFDYRGGGTVSMKGLSVRAFQRLWNRNNPNDTIAEDGVYGPATETRLAKSPVGGFPKGSSCTQSMSAPMDDMPMSEEPSGNDDEEIPVAVPDATEPSVDDGNDTSTEMTEEKTTTGATLTLPSGDAAQGCAVSPRGSGTSYGAVLAFGLLGTSLIVRRRRSRAA